MHIDTTLPQSLREEKLRLCTMIEGATSSSSQALPRGQTYRVGSVALTEQQGLESPAPTLEDSTTEQESDPFTTSEELERTETDYSPTHILHEKDTSQEEEEEEGPQPRIVHALGREWTVPARPVSPNPRHPGETPHPPGEEERTQSPPAVLNPELLKQPPAGLHPGAKPTHEPPGNPTKPYRSGPPLKEDSYENITDATTRVLELNHALDAQVKGSLT